MNVVVCIKPVPDISIVSLSNREPDRLDEESLVYVVDPCDRVAVQTAVQLRNEANASRVTLFFMAPPFLEYVVRQYSSREVDEVVTIWDPVLAVADSHVTGTIFAKAVATKRWNLVLCGSRSTDTQSGQVPYVIARNLDVPVVSGVLRLQQSTQAGTLLVERRLRKDRLERLEVDLPAVVAVEAGTNEPPYASLPDRIEALNRPIAKIALKDIGLSPREADEGARVLDLVRLARPKARPRAIFTPSSSLSARDRMQAIMSGGLAEKNQSIFEDDVEALSERFVAFLQSLALSHTR